MAGDVDKRKQTRLQALGGPLMTLVCIGCVLLCFGYLLLSQAQDKVSSRLRAVAACSAAVAAVSCLLVHLVDPGSPKADANDPPPTDQEDDACRIRECQLSDGQAWQQKWCRTCRLWRPYACGHCRLCGRCVLRLDHHCYWMGTCVGERNLRFFTLFLLSVGAALLALVALGVYRLTMLRCWQEPEIWWQSWEPLCIVVAFFCCPPMLSPVCMSVAMPMAGLGYSTVILTNANVHQERLDDSGQVTVLLSRLWGCSGPRTFCCGPVALKAPGLFAPVEVAPQGEVSEEEGGADDGPGSGRPPNQP